MLSIIASHTAMLIALWVVLILIGLTIVVRLLLGLRSSTAVADLATAVTRPLLVDVLPMLIVSWLTTIDPTHVLILIWYYVIAVVISVRQLLELGNIVRK
ncbi:hypothetical protein JI721_03275 [Alicyclobacillus cycloheptanicus]|uniref:YggT family protein n=1 Tax=Alicyclobacillus cycloheptanicus TaxID=1457 RepID=A0ABT9XLF5_9BACL|nr:hypothetical protein [Alicyclobacillus cycloheptanicus]MDQ0191139.1 hypothetical protein [Alicyclobacillus cycloheptanicus]WDM01880.1 hypothetical protein JI721_03275 [Alicyclobacillus cycloheptanicus]